MGEQNDMTVSHRSPYGPESEDQRLLFQGLRFLLSEESSTFRFVASLIEPVNPVALQSALDTVMESTNHFRITLVKQNDSFSIEQNTQPCVIYTGNAFRKIPEQTNGYLFYVSWEADAIYFTCDHFIADGRGSVRFINELLKAYCNCKYQAGLPQKALRSDPAFSPAELMSNYTRKRKQQQLIPVIELDGNTVTTCLINVEKAGLIRYAAEHGVKPFSALLFLLGNTIRKAYPIEYVGCNFTVDAREAMGVPNALYNCAASIHREIYTQQDELNMLREIDDSVKTTLTNKTIVAAKMAEHQKPLWDLYKMKVPHTVKQRAYSMAMQSVPFTYTLSYLGSPFAPDEKSLAKYLRDYYVIPMVHDVTAFFVAEVSFGSHMTLCCTDYLCDKAVGKRFASELESAGIHVNSIKFL